MAPTSGNKKAKAIQGSKLSRRPSGDTRGTSSKPKKSKSSGKAPPPKQVKSKPGQGPQPKKKKRAYSDKELDLPALNMITPAGVQKPRGKKKGKVFVDDQESMMTILAIVNAEKEGQIESKMVKARQMEAIREARQKEAEVRHQQKQSKLEETKSTLRRKRRRTSGDKPDAPADDQDQPAPTKTHRKRVSFA